MIRYQVLASTVGLFLFVLGAAMLPVLAVGLYTRDEGFGATAGALLCTWAAAGVLSLIGKRRRAELTLREGLLVVAAVWIAVSLFGSLPFWFSPQFPSFTDALFESVSGFTTTGATILPEVEVLPPTIQFWRCFTHWIGGMGIVLLGIAILPLLGIGGMHLYRAEFSGARSEKLTPRIAETAAALWKIYAGLTVAEYILLRVAGMGPFEAVLHAFSTLGTGGFSTRTASVGGFNSPLIEYVIIVFMLLAGVNFTSQYRLWVERRPGRFFTDVEVRAYLALVAVCTLIVGATLLPMHPASAETAFRAALFQVTSIITTTGFITADYEQWPPLSQILILVLMFVGGCTGSTAGGLKIVRILLLFKIIHREFRRMVHRHGVFAVRLSDRVVPDTAIQGLLSMVYLALTINFAACLVIAATGVDVLTTISAVAACMFNVGPALGAVGPADHYGHLPAVAKWALSVCMIAGRLEFYTAFVVLTPEFWKR